jgi:glycosyltransferase involved in cell wall biosynthesis
LGGEGGLRGRLVFVTQTIDADDPHLEITLDLVRALAARFDAVEVLCDRVRRHDLPSNVRLRTFGAPTRIGRGLRFAQLLGDALVHRRPDAVLTHMVPIFVVLAAPLAAPLRVPQLLWYTHWHAGRTLRLATRLAGAVLSVDVRSFPLDSPRVYGIGHAVDTQRFRPRPGRRTPGPLRLLALGRTEPRKRLPELLSAFAQAVAGGLDATLELRGPQITPAEARHLSELKAQVAAHEVLRERVTIAGPVPRAEVPAVLAAADALINPTRGETRGGALDKVVFEACACAVPVLAANPHLEGLLGGLPIRLLFRGGDEEDLARALTEFGAANRTTRLAVGRELRRRVEVAHSVETWADGVVRVLRGLRGQASPVHS